MLKEKVFCCTFSLFCGPNLLVLALEDSLSFRKSSLSLLDCNYHYFILSCSWTHPSWFSDSSIDIPVDSALISSISLRSPKLAMTRLNWESPGWAKSSKAILDSVDPGKNSLLRILECYKLVKDRVQTKKSTMITSWFSVSFPSGSGSCSCFISSELVCGIWRTSRSIDCSIPLSKQLMPRKDLKRNCFSKIENGIHFWLSNI